MFHGQNRLCSLKVCPADGARKWFKVSKGKKMLLGVEFFIFFRLINGSKSNIREGACSEGEDFLIYHVLSVWRAEGRGAWTLKRSPVSPIINSSHCFPCTCMCKSTPGHHLRSLFPSRAPQRHPWRSWHDCFFSSSFVFFKLHSSCHASFCGKLI